MPEKAKPWWPPIVYTDTATGNTTRAKTADRAAENLYGDGAYVGRIAIVTPTTRQAVVYQHGAEFTDKTLGIIQWDEPHELDALSFVKLRGSRLVY